MRWCERKRWPSFPRSLTWRSFTANISLLQRGKQRDTTPSPYPTPPHPRHQKKKKPSSVSELAVAKPRSAVPPSPSLTSQELRIWRKRKTELSYHNGKISHSPGTSCDYKEQCSQPWLPSVESPGQPSNTPIPGLPAPQTSGRCVHASCAVTALACSVCFPWSMALQARSSPLWKTPRRFPRSAG